MLKHHSPAKSGHSIKKKKQKKTKKKQNKKQKTKNLRDMCFVSLWGVYTFTAKDGDCL